jgi:hypothetical protein
VFVSLSRPAFLLGLICLFYLLWLNQGGAVKRFFSRQIWAIPARLSYSVYLVFPITSAQFNSSMDSALYLTYNEMFFQLIFNMLSAFLAAIVAYVLIEAPLRNLISSSAEAPALDGDHPHPESLIDISLLKQKNLDTYLQHQHLHVQATPTPDPSDYASTLPRDSRASSFGRMTLDSAATISRDVKAERQKLADAKF